MTEEHTTPADETMPVPAEQDEFEFAFPHWFRMTLYIGFSLFIAASVVIITRSMIRQKTLTSALAVLEARDGTPSDQEVEQARQDMASNPVHSFQYLLQSLLQDLDKDPRMATVMVLDKAIGWGETSRRRELLKQLVAAFHEDDGTPSDTFVLTDELKAQLADLITMRQSRADISYAEKRITEVLEWMHAGQPTAPHGTELRRLRILARGYDKKRFTSREAAVLRTIVDGSSLLGDTLKTLAPKFTNMLADVTTTEAVLSEDEVATCVKQRNDLEARYADGMIKVAETVTMISRQIADPQHDVFVDHPHIYQCVSLLGYRYDPSKPELHAAVRDEIAQAIVALRRHTRFAIIHLAEFASQTAINPVMAVETERLTASEHERQMSWQNQERLRRCIDLLQDTFQDYLENAEAYKIKDGPITSDDERDTFISKTIVGTLRSLSEDRTVGVEATRALEAMKAME
ncbi:MAG: hypothetical protein GY700_01035, partial [Propionibacteriaceae bacterium]|nr:hypothetical protein [Propionibacteriaceae bacterium]